ncbi:MAG TPA: site-specific DNA-methyltransferase [Acidimicrobiales bacterium]|nr:site-specific DNA-methyltransferase [Acidimicrobiales bacterium]
MAVPLQPVRTFGEPVDGWSNMLVFGDNLQVLRQLLNLKERGELRNADGTDGVRVCYIDPPFASQQEFTGGRKQKAYLDNVAGAEFVEHLRRRLVLIKELLSDDGSLFVHLDTRKVHYIKVVLDEVFGEGNFRNEVVWKRTHAHSGGRRFGAVHDTLLFYSKTDRYRWTRQFTEYNEDYVDSFFTGVDAHGRYRSTILTASGTRTGSSGEPWRGVDPTKAGRHWAIPGYVRELLDLPKGDVRSALDELDRHDRILWPAKEGGIPSFKQYLDDMKGVELQDMWVDIPPVAAQAKERTGYPTQKPVPLIQRVIGSVSRPGDIVLDAFVGSGTTPVAAQTMDDGPRWWIAVDSGKFSIYVTQARLLKQIGKAPTNPPFTLFNAGLYDYRALRELDRDRYVDFVLQLFQCRKVVQDIGGVEFHGYIGDDLVLVYDFKKHPDGRIGEQFVDDLANLCRGRLGQRCFIIAPASAVDPYEDYLTVADTRFFFLRIPYSIIAELHKRAFSDLRQPTSEARTNALIDAVGFDFIQPPHVQCRYTATDMTLEVEVVTFQSEAFAATPGAENIADLAMILVDYAYDDEVFKVCAVHFGEDLASHGWRFAIPRSAASERLMFVYVDLYGNEHREVRAADAFGLVAEAPAAATARRGAGAARAPAVVLRTPSDRPLTRRARASTTPNGPAKAAKAGIGVAKTSGRKASAAKTAATKRSAKSTAAKKVAAAAGVAPGKRGAKKTSQPVTAAKTAKRVDASKRRARQ